ncbi:MAG: hypothetical protein NC244_07815 [Alistipes senegalensis]|nr:hypothetical protein [Alistipes senegalensis]
MNNLYEYLCYTCGKTFYTTRKDKKYCCKDCRQQATRKVKRPRADALQNLLLKYSVEEIGRMYGVCGNTVRNWCKQKNIDCSYQYLKKQRDELKQKNSSKAKNKKKKKKRHLDYNNAPVYMAGYWVHNQEFKNIYEAVDYVKRNHWTKAKPETVLSCIKRVILEGKGTYLDCYWISPSYVKEHNNSKRCRNKTEKGEEEWVEE